MAVCTYDNPNTMRRECWRDGALVCFYCAQLLLRRLLPGERQPIPAEHFFFGANVGDWNPGQVVGDAVAMPLEIRP